MRLQQVRQTYRPPPRVLHASLYKWRLRLERCNGIVQFDIRGVEGDILPVVGSVFELLEGVDSWERHDQDS